MASSITLAKAKRYFTREIGCVENDEDLLDLIHDAVEYMLFSGGGEILREWKLPVKEGRVTLPKDLETPIKYKFSRLPNAGFGTFHSAYYSYSSNAVDVCCGPEWKERFEAKVGRVYTQFRPPICGVRLCATTRNKKDVGKSIMVAGKHRKKEIAPLHNNFKTSGELLTIYHEDDNQKRYSAFTFDEITGVVKDETCDWMMLSGIDAVGDFYFLSHYHPDETHPNYREIELFSCPQQQCDQQIHILGRVNPSVRYIRDEDILPIASTEMLRMLASRAKYESANSLTEVANYETRIQNLIRKQVAYQGEPNRAVSVNLRASGASLTNV